MTTTVSQGTQIQVIRIIRGLKQGKLAEIIGVRQPTLSEFENDKLNPSEKRMKAIKAALHWPEQAEVAFEILAGDGDELAWL